MILILGLIGIALFGPVITLLLFIIGSLLQALGAKSTASTDDTAAAQARAKANAEAKAQAKQKIAPPPSSHTPQKCRNLCTKKRKISIKPVISYSIGNVGILCCALLMLNQDKIPKHNVAQRINIRPATKSPACFSTIAESSIIQARTGAKTTMQYISSPHSRKVGGGNFKLLNLKGKSRPHYQNPALN